MIGKTRPVWLASSLFVAAALHFGCGVETDEASAEASKQGAIIGGSTLSQDIGTRRAAGLVDVGTNCSGALFHRDWVITATHCLNLAPGGSNLFSMPRTDSGSDTRQGIYISSLSTSDISIVQLSAAAADMMWPNITRSMYTGSASSLAGTTLSCFGRGSNAYKSPSGTTGFGTWKSLNKKVARAESSAEFGVELKFEATSTGSEIPSDGDSGGPCFVTATGNIAAVMANTQVECANPSTPQTCKDTITKIVTASAPVTAPFASYIAQKPSQTFNKQFYPLALNANWTLYNPSFARPHYANTANNNMVQLQGRAKNSFSLSSPFTLPATARPTGRVFLPILLNDGLNGRLTIETNGVVTLSFEGTAPSSPYNIILDGVQFARSPLTTALPLQANWTTGGAGNRAPGFFTSGNFVYLVGAVANASTSANPVFGLLPSGSRPDADVYVKAVLCNGTRGRVRIQPSGAMTVQSEGAFSNATCFTSLEGVSFALSSTGFTAASYQNGWTTAPFSTRAVRFINDGGILRFQGAAANGTSAVIHTLPAAFRPATQQSFWIDGFAAKKTSTRILSSGEVFSLSTTGAGGFDSAFTSLEGASFGL